MSWGFHYRKHDKGMSKVGVWVGGTEYKPQWSICLPYKWWN
ncbi:hypothetical protein BTT_64410 (plasmid) [Bacillus thuringiensis serovar morrisoni str. 4AA1]|nr:MULTISPECIES: hypothetical protein [Bacillus]MED3102235.1 hypothetical protein [Bacillus thuringiensis]UOC05188.1 hypothetical protein BTT_64410 [Bacillus thuringiensis serovar morrisoni str. 4AA1]WMR09857.1 hypothetical protein RCI28_29610 [Bacillus thuringiensis serovar tenebrionis]WMR16271.1 hypothetical protein RCI27_31760 [Bacillus thuringiensis serovar tenebrionis]